MFRLSHEIIDNNVIFTKITVKKELEIIFSNLGASVYEILFSDNQDNLENVLITPDRKNWLSQRTFAGSIVGPLAGRYETTGTHLEQNRPPLHFHGGANGWDKILWTQSIKEEKNHITIFFTHSTPAYEVTIQYKIDSAFVLSLIINILPNEEVYLNPTNHMYFNLNGTAFSPITNHLFQIDAESIFMEADGLIQDFKPEKNPATLDYYVPKSLSTLPEINGLNHTYQLMENHSAVLKHPTNGRQITFKTTLPCAVIYSFNVAQKAFSKNKHLFPLYSGITFESQYPANNLPLVIFDSSHPYHSETTYAFSIQ